MGVLPLPVLFMIAFAIALIINYPDWPSSAAAWRSTRATCCRWCRLSSPPASSPASCRARAWSRPCRAACWPCSLTPWVRTADITALVSLPFTFFMSNDAFYFGVLPILSEAAQGYGISAVEMARASLIGQPVHLLSPLVPSTYLLVGLAGVEFGDHQRYALGPR